MIPLTFSLPLIPLIVIPVVLLIRKARFKDMKFSLILYCLAMGWCYFFNPLGTTFECQKKSTVVN